MKILLVDDSPGMRRLVRRILEELNSEICEGSCGGEAVECYVHARPDVVIIDIRMEPVDGLEAAKRILRIDQNAQVIFMTDYDDEYIRGAAKSLGARAYVLKKDLLGICDVVRAVLGRAA